MKSMKHYGQGEFGVETKIGVIVERREAEFRERQGSEHPVCDFYGFTPGRFPWRSIGC